MIEGNRLRILKEWLSGYSGAEPFSLHLNNLFRQHKNMGSRDRRAAREACYAALRVGNALPKDDWEKKIFAGLFSHSSKPNDIVLHIAERLKIPLVDAEYLLPIEEKFDWLRNHIAFAASTIFPFTEKVSEQVSIPNLLNHFFTQPAIFVWYKTKDESEILTALKAENIECVKLDARANCRKLPTGVSLDKLPEILRKKIQVQDLSSQMAAPYFEPKPNDKVWDCCAASGGKSLLLHTTEPSVDLYVSDVRANILQNLKKRFEDWGIIKYNQTVLNLENEHPKGLTFLGNKTIDHGYFDTILLDAPCTGSGTWRRQPERLSQISEAEIASYSKKQKRIAANVVPYLKPAGKLIYMTCSLYAEENENQVAAFCKELNLELIQNDYLNAFTQGGDCLYLAVLRKL